MLAYGPERREVVLQAMMQLVPPGAAFRKVEHQRQRLRGLPRKTERRTWTGPTPAGDSRTVAVGQRRVAYSVLASALRDERVVQFERQGEAWLQYGPAMTHGPTRRMAFMRHEQERCRSSGDATECPSWYKHVREAAELYDAYGRERQKERHERRA